jgi:hypothetical protein
MVADCTQKWKAFMYSVDKWKVLPRVAELYKRQWLFAQKMGVRPGFVCDVLNGRKTINYEQLKKWADTLDCDPDDILKK